MDSLEWGCGAHQGISRGGWVCRRVMGVFWGVLGEVYGGGCGVQECSR